MDTYFLFGLTESTWRILMEIPYNIKESLLSKTLFRLEYERGIVWTISDLEITIIRSDTVTGNTRLIVDAIAKDHGMNAVRVYLYDDGEIYLDPIAADPLVDNNGSPYVLFVHTSNLSKLTFSEVYSYLDRNLMLNVELIETIGILGTAVWDPYITISYGGSTRSCTIMLEDSICAFKYGGVFTGTSVVSMNLTGINNALTYPIISRTIVNKFNAITGCECKGLAITTSITPGKIVSIKVKSQLSSVSETAIPGNIVCLRSDPSGNNIWALSIDGASTYLWTVDPITLVASAVSFQISPILITGVPTDLFVTTSNFYVGTPNGIFRVSRLGGNSENITQTWIGVTAFPAWGIGYKLGKVIVLKNGKFFAMLSWGGVTKYGVVINQDGTLHSQPIPLPESIDPRTKPVEFLDNRIVLMNAGLAREQVNVVELDLLVRRYVFYSEADAPAVDISFPCLSIDGNVFIVHASPTNLAFLSPDLRLPPRSADWILWTKNTLVNNF